MLSWLFIYLYKMIGLYVNSELLITMCFSIDGDFIQRALFNNDISWMLYYWVRYLWWRTQKTTSSRNPPGITCLLLAYASLLIFSLVTWPEKRHFIILVMVNHPFLPLKKSWSKGQNKKTSRKWLTVAIFWKWQDSSVALWIETAVILNWR